MALGLLSKDIELHVWAKQGSSGTASYINLYGLQSIPSLGGDIDRVETTTLADGTRTYINGLRDYSNLEFKFLYIPADDMEAAAGGSTTKSNYEYYSQLEKDEDGVRIGAVDIEVLLPDDTAFYFPGEIALSLDEAEVNAALTFTLRVGLSADITMDAPTTHHTPPVLVA